MAKTNNKATGGLLSNAFGVAKKLSSTGVSIINHVAPESVTKVIQPQKNGQTFDGASRDSNIFDVKKYDNPQQLLREHVPNVSRQLLGRHFSTVNNVANFVAPQFSDKISDYIFDQLNHFSSEISSVDAVLDEAGVRDLEELTQDVDRSKRISQALSEQNKWIASIQGALTGATGVIGSTIDIPASLIMTLRVIYQVGRSYGFDLSKESDQDIVQFIFRQVDLSLIAEKQTLLMAIKALSSTLQNSDIKQLQQMLGSDTDAEALKKYVLDENGQFKWAWLNQLPKVSVLNQLSRLSPLASAGISAVYSRRLIDEVNQKAQQVFSDARQYIIQHQDIGLSPLHAYERSIELLAQATPKLLESIIAKDAEVIEPILDQEVPVKGNKNIRQVKVIKKADAVEVTNKVESKEAQVSEGLDALANKVVTPHEPVEAQKPALTEIESFDLDEENPIAEQKAPTKTKPRKAKTTAVNKVTKNSDAPTEK
ncbi:EcsC family protein [Acinetobacter sp. ANC 5054]|uniref:EcsC family protein n=1 Tax=Acinetobacter sp. ANC 5054 TaxID=1977877 RepID=UPI000A339C82|nr:EcsC family protein [Acinetobacter sp. ANC 5054]OTG80518.1 EcsC family protein [Acinetobacter sp. ANC 5054]